MSFRPIPELPEGFLIEISKRTGIYYYFDSRTGVALYLNYPGNPPINPLSGWNLSTGGSQGQVYYKDGLFLPYYSNIHEYNLAINDWFSRHPPATGGAGVSVSPPPGEAFQEISVGVKRPRQKNNSTTSNSKRQALNTGKGIPTRNWTELCKEPIRDPRHVTVVIHNTENNTFLIGNENKYLHYTIQKTDLLGNPQYYPDGNPKMIDEEYDQIKFTSHLRSDKSFNFGLYLSKWHYRLHYILDISNDIIRRHLSQLNTIFITNNTINEALINTIKTKIVNIITEANKQDRYHVKDVIKDPIECSDIIIMQRKPFKPHGFPKGAVEQVDVVAGDENQTILNAARREVEEELRISLADRPTNILGKIIDPIESNIVYIAVDNEMAQRIITTYSGQQIHSELFDVQFVNCTFLKNNKYEFNDLSQQIIEHIKGSQRIIQTISNGSPISDKMLLNKCHIGSGGGTGSSSFRGGRQRCLRRPKHQSRKTRVSRKSKKTRKY